MIFNKLKGTGRKQTPKQEFSSAVNWLLFQLRGMSIDRAFYQVVYHRHRTLLSAPARFKLDNLMFRAEHAIKELKAVKEEVAQWNKNKKWLD